MTHHSARAAEECETFVVGLLYRRAFREVMQERGLSYIENKRWLSSEFHVWGTRLQLLPVQLAVESFN